MASTPPLTAGTSKKPSVAILLTSTKRKKKDKDEEEDKEEPKKLNDYQDANRVGNIIFNGDTGFLTKRA